ncbi:hypothetical protein [Salinisphaera sp. G21_0]|uniref:hypothetical protein n=1 Tax=Salinisphaera sp. G21_0 TaxID=2821094 RepID=UPI001ADAB221|nr:hypothetical protein [Salinisphaera sp. G21_0]MBO9483345.1 hypothetical protein [Salinisphaera sp. G21_0]
MDIPIGQSGYHHNSTVTLAGQSDANLSYSGEQRDNQKKGTPVCQAVPVTPMVAASDNALIKQNKSLSEYIAQHCHSLRNLIAVTTPQTEVSLLPENLLYTSEQRLLSIAELDEMQRHISLQTDITINGKRYKLETLPDDTPLFYQFYCRDQKASIDDESIRIFQNNCLIEQSRAAIILINNDLINKTVAAQVRQLEQTVKNVRVVDVAKLLPEGDVAGIKVTQNMEDQFYLELDARVCTLKQHYFTDGRIRTYSSFHDIMDILQFVAMYHCDKVCELAGIKTNSRGCIKIDWDMELIAPIGTVKCPDGISTFVMDRIQRTDDAGNNELIHTLRSENSLVAVTRPQHPIMAESVCPYPASIFCQFSGAINQSFSQSLHSPDYDVKQFTIKGDGEINSLKMLCRLKDREKIAGNIDPAQQLSLSYNPRDSWKQKIAFPLTGIKADQSRVRGISSWQKKTPEP